MAGVTKRLAGRTPIAPCAPRRYESVAVSDCGSSLELAFHWTGDRFVHTLALIDEGEGRAWILRSVEGKPQDAWPSSPPLQHCQFAGGHDAAGFLATGMAGHSYWSLAARPVAGIGWEFDWACRAAEPLGPLGTTYQTTASVHSFDVRRLGLRHDRVGWELIAFTEVLATVWERPRPGMWPEPGRQCTHPRQPFTIVTARPDPMAAGTGAVRWGYTVAAGSP